MPSNYTEIIQFNNQVGGVKVRQKGIKISDNLTVAYASPYSAENRFRIFSIISGRPVVNLDFSNQNDAEYYAKLLDKTYQEFWPLLSEYPRMDIPQVCMWSVPEGIRIYETIKMIENQECLITLNEIKLAWIKAEKEVEKWNSR